MTNHDQPAEGQSTEKSAQAAGALTFWQRIRHPYRNRIWLAELVRFRQTLDRSFGRGRRCSSFALAR